MFPIRDSVLRTHPPLVVYGIILANSLAFFYEISLGEDASVDLLYRYALVPARYFRPDWAAAHGLSANDYLPFLTNTFLHGGWLHIILNLWVLYIFGPALEDRLGGARFAALYLLAGIAASFTHAVFNANSTAPTLGASGAIAGIIAAYAVRFPTAWVTLVIPIFIFPFFFNVPAVLFAGLWFLMQLISGFSALAMPGAGGGIAWWAHAGGFIAGGMLLLMLDPRHAALPVHRGSETGEGPWSRRGPWG